MSNSNNESWNKQNLRERFGAVPIHIAIGFLVWMLKIFNSTLDNNDNVSLNLKWLLEVSSFCATFYIINIIYRYCEEKSIGVFGRSSRIIGIVINIAVFLLLNMFTRIG
ncbi:MAG TPA: hypothetical protein VEG39_06545 [Clostridia bacterium]|nr:hypothetical protein [Clostridia bacterium]